MLLFPILQRRDHPYAHLPLPQYNIKERKKKWKKQEPVEIRSRTSIKTCQATGKGKNCIMKAWNPHAAIVRTEFLFPLFPTQCPT